MSIKRFRKTDQVYKCQEEVKYVCQKIPEDWPSQQCLEEGRCVYQKAQNDKPSQQCQTEIKYINQMAQILQLYKQNNVNTVKEFSNTRWTKKKKQMYALNIIEIWYKVQIFNYQMVHVG